MLDIQTEITVDCDDLSCVIFKDTTKSYNETTNPGGYGYPPNYPSISNIVSVTFLLNVDGDDYTYESSGYLPNSLGTSEICLKNTDFASGSNTAPAYVKGKTYQLSYSLNLENDEQITTDITFKFPCCGDAVTSSLSTDYTAEEVQGCASFDFTDTTGTYDADTNPGGYGGPNADYSDITETLITITTNQGVINITDWVPTAEDQTLNINANTLGFATDVITDQIITIEYSVYVLGQCRVGYKTGQELFDCQTVACIAKRGAVLLNSACNECGTNEQKEVNYVLQLKYEYEVIRTSADIGDFTCIDGDIEKLYKACNAGCNGC